MKTRFTLSALLLVPGIALLTALTGCIGYTLGNNLPPGIRSVFVPVFVNQANQPGLETLTTSATIAEFQTDGSLKVRPREQANSVLEVILTHYSLTPLRYNKNQITTAQEYRLTIRADVVLRKLPGNQIVSQTKNVEGFTDFVSLSDLPSSQRDALPKAAADLAHRIVKTVVEYW